MFTCTHEDCNEEDIHPRNFDGDHYCEEHYAELIWDELTSWFYKWEKGKETPEQFKYFLGRVADEENWEQKNGGALTKHKIHKRAYNYKKIDDGCVFDIERHLGAWGGGKERKDVIERWRVNLDNKVLEVIDKWDAD